MWVENQFLKVHIIEHIHTERERPTKEADVGRDRNGKRVREKDRQTELLAGTKREREKAE